MTAFFPTEIRKLAHKSATMVRVVETNYNEVSFLGAVVVNSAQCLADMFNSTSFLCQSQVQTVSFTRATFVGKHITHAIVRA